MEHIVMREMGWSYKELEETPIDVVKRELSYINTESAYRKMITERGR